MSAKAGVTAQLLAHTFEVGDLVVSKPGVFGGVKRGRVISCGADEIGDYVEVEWAMLAGTHYWHPHHLYLEDEE